MKLLEHSLSFFNEKNTALLDLLEMVVFGLEMSIFMMIFFAFLGH